MVGRRLGCLPRSADRHECKKQEQGRKRIARHGVPLSCATVSCGRSTAPTNRHTPRTKRPSRARRRAPFVISVSIARRQVSRSQPHNRAASSAVSARPGISRYSPTIRRLRSASSSCADLNGGIVDFRRSRGEGPDYCSLPHSSQNCAPGRSSAPHSTHVCPLNSVLHS